MKFRAYGASVGRSVHIGVGSHFVNPWNIFIGDDCVLGQGVRLWSEVAERRLRRASNVKIERNTVFNFRGDLVFGAVVSKIVPGGHVDICAIGRFFLEVRTRDDESLFCG